MFKIDQIQCNVCLLVRLCFFWLAGWCTALNLHLANNVWWIRDDIEWICRSWFWCCGCCHESMALLSYAIIKLLHLVFARNFMWCTIFYNLHFDHMPKTNDDDDDDDWKRKKSNQSWRFFKVTRQMCKLTGYYGVVHTRYEYFIELKRKCTHTEFWICQHLSADYIHVWLDVLWLCVWLNKCELFSSFEIKLHTTKQPMQITLEEEKKASSASTHTHAHTHLLTINALWKWIMMRIMYAFHFASLK